MVHSDLSIRVKMKLFLCIFVWTCGQVFGSKNILDDQEQNYYNRNDVIERPCPTYELNCVRNFFAQNTGCTPVRGSYKNLKDPVVKTLPLHVPHANVTVTINNALLKGLTDGKIKEFYINKNTDALVLEVVFDHFVVESERTVATYYFPGKEPLEASDISLVSFSDLSLTLTIQKFHDAKSARTHVYAYLPDPYPLLLAGPGLKEPKGLSKTWMCKHIIGLSSREGMVQGSSVYMDLYLQTKVCDFSLYPRVMTDHQYRNDRY